MAGMSAATDAASAAFDPTAAGAPGAAGGEPRAAEPTAPEPQAAEPQWPNHEEFGWDDWDGSADGLPEQLQPWYSKFDERYNKTLTQAKRDRQEELERHEAMARQWRRMYEANFNGEDDPRIAEYETNLAQYKRAVERAESGYAEAVESLQGEYQTASDEYFDFVHDIFSEFLDGMDAATSEAIMAAVDHLPLHKAVKYAQEGVLAEAVAIAQQGGNPALIDRIIQAESARRPAPPPPRKTRAAAEVITGAEPATAPETVPSTKPAGDRMSRLQQAARNAIKAHSRGR